MIYWRGKYNSYHWFEVVGGYELTLGDLIQNLPELFLDRYLAITHFDGATFNLNSEEKERQWYSKNEIAYSQKLTNVDLNSQIYDNYDQWYLFDELTEFEEIVDFVNYENFSLQSELVEWEALQKRFWSHMEMIEPKSFIIDGVRLIYVTKSKEEIDKILKLVNTKA